MQTKQKKLSLSRLTVKSLSEAELRRAGGGTDFDLEPFSLPRGSAIRCGIDSRYGTNCQLHSENPDCG